MSEKKQVVPLAELHFDSDLYSRDAFNTVNKNELVRALEAGEELPPIIADEETHAIIDGVHRFRAHEEHFGPEGSIAVIFRKYPDRKAMILDAISLNARHGRKLTAADQIRCIYRAKKVGITDLTIIAKALGVAIPRIEELSARVGQPPKELVSSIGPDPVPIKRALGPVFSGKQLTVEQYNINRMTSGTNSTGCITQVIGFIKAGAYNYDDPAVRSKFLELCRLIPRDIIMEALNEVEVVGNGKH